MKNGIHIISDLYDCDFLFYINNNSIDKIMLDISNIIKNNNLNIVGEKYYEFCKNSFTLVYLLSESHLTLHTWPKEKYISLDIFVCNYNNNNNNNAKKIFKELLLLFKSGKKRTQIIYR